MKLTLDKTQGCLLGLALGDAIGAPYEGGIIERCLWKLLGKTRRGENRWTDDTQMSLDVAESYLAMGRIDSDDLAARFARSYRWSRGYGPGAAKVLKRIAAGEHWREASRSVYADGSFGNGAAMRAPVIGIIYHGDERSLRDAARRSAIVTHAHPQAIDGAVLIAQVTAWAFGDSGPEEILERGLSLGLGDEFASRLKIAKHWIKSDNIASNNVVVRQLGNKVSAKLSCVTALYLALRFRDCPFADMLQFICTCRGDADTIGAMAGAIWGAANGCSNLPIDLLSKLEQRERLMNLAATLHQPRENVSQ